MTVVAAGPGAASFGLFALAGGLRIADIAATDGTTRTSINAAYQVVRAEDRLAVQAVVEGIGVPVAIGATGVLLLVLDALDLGTGAVIVFGLVLGVIWTVVALRVYRSYTGSLADEMRRRTLDARRSSRRGRRPAVRGLLGSDDPATSGSGSTCSPVRCRRRRTWNCGASQRMPTRRSASARSPSSPPAGMRTPPSSSAARSMTSARRTMRRMAARRASPHPQTSRRRRGRCCPYCSTTPTCPWRRARCRCRRRRRGSGDRRPGRRRRGAAAGRTCDRCAGATRRRCRAGSRERSGAGRPRPVVVLAALAALAAAEAADLVEAETLDGVLRDAGARTRAVDARSAVDAPGSAVGRAIDDESTSRAGW